MTQAKLAEAIALHQGGQLAQAKALCENIVLSQPNDVEALYLLGIIALQTQNPEQAIEFIDRAIEINATRADFYVSRGNALQLLKKWTDSIHSYDQALALKPDCAEVYFNRGNALQALDKLKAAVESYNYAITLKPDFAEAYVNRGLTLQMLMQLTAAIENYDHAIALQPDISETYINRGLTLQQLGRLEAAVESYSCALAIKPNFAQAYFNRGNAFQDLRQFEQAIENYNEAIRIKPDYADAYYNRGLAYQKNEQFEQALENYQHTLRINPNYIYLVGTLLYIKMQLCDWYDFEETIAALVAQINHNQKSSSSFPLLAATNSLSLQCKASKNWMNYNHPFNDCLGSITKYPRKEKIRIAYFSADFYYHPTSILLAELFELHDRNRFELIAFSFGPDIKDEMRERIEKVVDQFIDVRYHTDKAVALLARQMEIDIAIDLGGCTAYSRPGIFSYRAAPMQVNYLGWPGTMGVEYFDYLIADQTIIPKELQQHYVEKIVYLPDSYQPNDAKRKISDHIFSRSELGLPETGFIFCCFNNTYKITPSLFDSWMRILKAVPQSVLFLYADNSTAEQNLRKEAQTRGVNFGRLVFGKRLPPSEYLARYKVADLFLNTFPYNAGATASDALWVGLPVLTMVGETFVSRVTASLLQAIGLSELIAESQEKYEALAIELARNPTKLSAIKAKLAANRLAMPLFDTPLFAQHLENAYVQMVERYYADIKPDHIYVESVNENLEITIQTKLNEAMMFFREGQFTQAKAVYISILILEPKNAEALLWIGVIEHQMHNLQDAITFINRAIDVNPNHALCYFSKAHLLQDLNYIEVAIENYNRAIALKPDFAEAYANRGNALLILNKLDAAVASYEAAITIQPKYEYLLGTLLYTKMKLCDWSNFDENVNELIKGVENNEKSSIGFYVIPLTASPAIHRKAAEIWINDKYPFNNSLGEIYKYPKSDKIRIGYFSADFRLHAVSILLAEVFESHDKERFEVVAFSLGPDINDDMRKRIKPAFDQFVDVQHLSDKDVALLSRQMRIDIAIDLGGTTIGSRPGIFSYRAAPIQVNYLGYPGTMGADYFDYLIADQTIIPKESQQHFVEKVAYLPNSYQANDTKRIVSERVFSRLELGLPESGFVFCCFNNNYKITPYIFDSWMRILKAVKGSVLFLYVDNAAAEQNLKKEAECRGVDPSRLVFAGALDFSDYLARYKVADLFLNTFPYDAGTTASDALWVGLPVLTRVGDAFVSRVAASLLTAIGLSELITDTQQNYEALAIELATHPAKLNKIKAKLVANKLTTPLFNIKLFTQHLESAYTQMVNRYHDDLATDHIYVQ